MLTSTQSVIFYHSFGQTALDLDDYFWKKKMFLNANFPANMLAEIDLQQLGGSVTVCLWHCNSDKNQERNINYSLYRCT